MATREEAEIRQRFDQRYGQGASSTMVTIERAVIGGDWGANGYTTVEQADVIGGRLGLGPGIWLLDLGAGQGWPGLYLAARSGCRVVLSDVPIAGLRRGSARTAAERLTDRASVVAASARALPFPSESFDAVAHTDVLC
jgi:hypothetical protein